MVGGVLGGPGLTRQPTHTMGAPGGVPPLPHSVVFPFVFVFPVVFSFVFVFVFLFVFPFVFVFVFVFAFVFVLGPLVEAEEMGWKKSEQFYNNIHIMDSFTISFEQLLLNKLLLLDDTEKFLDKLAANSPYRPEQLQIRITNDSLELMGQIRYKGRILVITIGCEPKLMENGSLKLTMLPVKVGAMNIPHRLIKNYLAQAVQFQPKQKKNHEISNRNELSNELIYSIAPKLRRLIENRYVIWEPVFRAVEDKRARITNVSLSTGRIELEIKPLPMNN